MAQEPWQDARDMVASDGPGAAGGGASSLSEQDVQRLYLHYSREIRAYIRGLVPPSIDADDLFQDVFLIAVRKAGQFDPQASFKAWVFGIVRHEIMDRMRRYAKHAQKSLSPELIDHLAQEGLGRHDSMEPRMSALRKCIELLTPSAYRMLRLFYYEGLGAKTIGEQLRMNQQSVYNALRRTRLELRDCVKRQERT